VVDAMKKTRAERAVDLEAWADRVSIDDLQEADTRGLRAIVDLVDQRDHVEEEITAAVRAARQANRSWSEIGAMLGVSKQAAQRKYGHKISA
jgi:predicted RecB family endonuclease